MGKVVTALLGFMLVMGPVGAFAKEPLGDAELASAGASGIVTEVTIVGAPQTLQDELRGMVLNEVVGDSRVVTRVMIEGDPAADSSLDQKVNITQSWNAPDEQEEDDGKGKKVDYKLVLGKNVQRGLSMLVVNNILGSNLVETIINLYVGGLAQSQAGNLGATTSSVVNVSSTPNGNGQLAATASGGQQPLPALMDTLATQNADAAAPLYTSSPAVPSVSSTPSTLQGTISMLQSLQALSPDIAPDIAALQHLQNRLSNLPGISNP